MRFAVQLVDCAVEPYGIDCAAALGGYRRAQVGAASVRAVRVVRKFIEQTAVCILEEDGQIPVRADCDGDPLELFAGILARFDHRQRARAFAVAVDHTVVFRQIQIFCAFLGLPGAGVEKALAVFQRFARAEEVIRPGLRIECADEQVRGDDRQGRAFDIFLADRLRAAELIEIGLRLFDHLSVDLLAASGAEKKLFVAFWKDEWDFAVILNFQQRLQPPFAADFLRDDRIRRAEGAALAGEPAADKPETP